MSRPVRKSRAKTSSSSDASNYKYISLLLVLVAIIALPAITSNNFMSIIASRRLETIQTQLKALPTLLFRPQHQTQSLTRPAHRLSSKMSTTKQDAPSQHPPVQPSSLLDGLGHRRSIYALNNSITVPDADLSQILNRVMLNVPSAFNSQTTRTALLFGAQHAKFWDLVAAEIEADGEKTGDKAHAERGLKRLPGFKGARGTVLFFEAGSAVDKLNEIAKAYSDLVPGWSDHTSGMHQFAVWAAFEAAGLGANLQHYNYVPGVDAKVTEGFGLPSDWTLKAQLVFGAVNEGGWPGEAKDKVSTEETVRVLGEST